jgi:uncharacterized membrane protein
MNRAEFLRLLRERLKSLPQSEIEKSIGYYSEIIDDKVEDGMTEEEAVAGLDGVDAIAEKIMYDMPLPVLIKARKKTKWNAVQIILVILGFPVWFPLLMAFLSVVLSFYIVIWSVFISLYAAVLAFAVSGLASIAFSPAFFATNVPAGLFVLGCGFILVALAIFTFHPITMAAKEVIGLTALILRKIKSLFIKKETV